MGTTKLIGIAAALALMALGCGGKDDASQEEASGSGGKVTETGTIDPTKNPLQALAKAAESAKEAGERMQEAAKRGPIEPVKFDALLPHLPDAPDGWTAEEAEGQTSSMGEFKVTVVSRRYKSEDGGQSVKIQITDGAYNEMAYMPFRMMSQFSNESTKGFQKGVTIDDNPGFETWDKNAKSSDLFVLVSDRFLVQLEGRGLESGAIREWLPSVELSKLADLGK